MRGVQEAYDELQELKSVLKAAEEAGDGSKYAEAADRAEIVMQEIEDGLQAMKNGDLSNSEYAVDNPINVPENDSDFIIEGGESNGSKPSAMPSANSGISNAINAAAPFAINTGMNAVMQAGAQKAVGKAAQKAVGKAAQKAVGKAASKALLNAGAKAVLPKLAGAAFGGPVGLALTAASIVLPMITDAISTGMMNKHSRFHGPMAQKLIGNNSGMAAAQVIKGIGDSLGGGLGSMGNIMRVQQYASQYPNVTGNMLNANRLLTQGSRYNTRSRP